ncbi:MAG: glyceraldehyde 3-phosphate dehydrogenase NAD-binding domain-containing protein [Anaerolineae bacterium]
MRRPNWNWWRSTTSVFENMVYLLKYDTVYGRYERSVEARDGKIAVDGHEIAYVSEKDPTKLPWGTMGVGTVFECTGIFTKQEDAGKHITAGATWVIISGPIEQRNADCRAWCQHARQGSLHPLIWAAAPPMTSHSLMEKLCTAASAWSKPS